MHKRVVGLLLLMEFEVTLLIKILATPNQTTITKAQTIAATPDNKTLASTIPTTPIINKILATPEPTTTMIANTETVETTAITVTHITDNSIIVTPPTTIIAIVRVERGR